MVAVLAPWALVDEAQAAALEAALARELAADHLLAGKAVHAVARRVDNDDVLFEVEGGGYAVVHLAWARSLPTAPHWPTTQMFASFEDWIERRMKPDHDGYAGADPER